MPEKVKKTDEEWKRELTPEQFKVCRRKGTERPFTGALHDSKTPGTYVCACCGNPLFDSETKSSAPRATPISATSSTTARSRRESGIA
jgi:peptide-methionine (R)-S-oxide reductase